MVFLKRGLMQAAFCSPGVSPTSIRTTPSLMGFCLVSFHSDVNFMWRNKPIFSEHLWVLTYTHACINEINSFPAASPKKVPICLSSLLSRNLFCSVFNNTWMFSSTHDVALSEASFLRGFTLHLCSLCAVLVAVFLLVLSPLVIPTCS